MSYLIVIIFIVYEMVLACLPLCDATKSSVSPRDRETSSAVSNTYRHRHAMRDAEPEPTERLGRGAESQAGFNFDLGQTIAGGDHGLRPAGVH